MQLDSFHGARFETGFMDSAIDLSSSNFFDVIHVIPLHIQSKFSVLWTISYRVILMGLSVQVEILP
jgi:hypothetical protein